MVGAHDTFVVDAHVHEELIQCDILLGVSTNQIVILQAGYCQHRLFVELGVVQAVQQVDSTRAGGCNTHSQAPGVLGISTGHESGSFLMTYLNELNLVLGLSKCLDNPVHAVARQSEHNFHAPVEQTIHQYFPACHKHPSAQGSACRFSELGFLFDCTALRCGQDYDRRPGSWGNYAQC